MTDYFNETLLSSDSINFLDVLDKSQTLAEDLLANFIKQSNFTELTKLFPKSKIVTDYLNANLQSDIVNFPEVEIVSTRQINGANGAFSSQTNKIYLAQEFLLAHQSNIDIVAAVLLEEYGHYLDNELNSVDTPGDEGAIFSAVVRGEELTDSELQQLGNEDDSAVVTIDGEEVEIEQNIGDITLFSDSINFNEDGEFDFNFQTANYINKWTGSNIRNSYTYSSGNDFVPRFNFNGDTYSVPIAGFDIGLASLGANAGLTVHPGYFEAGLKVNAGYNLGEFNFNFGSLQASIDAGIRNNKLDIDIDTNIELPDFNYILPYAYANLDAVMGYDFRVDGFINGHARVGVEETESICGGGWLNKYICEPINKLVHYEYSKEYSTNIINQKNSHSRRLVNLDTRSNDNYIDYIIDRIDFGGNEGTVPRSKTNGFFESNFKLPSFENTFKPISIPDLDLPNFDPNFPTIASPEDEYIWEISEETTLAEASLSLDNLLAKIPLLSWLSQTDDLGQQNIGGYNFGLKYDWRALALDLSANLNFGYNFKLGITDLLPQFDSERSEISSLEFELENVSNKKELGDLLVDIDGDDQNDIDIWLKYDPTIIFEAEAYLKPELNFDWDVGIFNAEAIIANKSYKTNFTLREGDTTNLAGTTIDIIAPIKREVKFSEVYRWLNPNFQPSFTEYNLEIPFSVIDPSRFGSKGDDFFEGSPEDDTYMAGEGNDRVVVSEGNDDHDGDDGIDALVLNRSQTYSANSNTITDDADNQTTFETFELLELAGIDLASAIAVTGNSTSLEVVGIGTNSNDRIENITIQNLQTIGGDDVIDGTWSGYNIDSGAGNDNITLSKTVDATNTVSIINTGEGDDTLNLTVIPQGFESSFESPSLYEINLDSGSDSLTVGVAEPIANDLEPIIRRSRVVANGYAGEKTIDLPFGVSHVGSEAKLTIEASNIRELFALDAEAESDRLFIDIADSNLNYTLNNTDPETATKTDEIVGAFEATLDITDPNLPVTIEVDPQDFNAFYLNIEAGNSSVTEVVLDGSNVTDIPNSTVLNVNGEYTVVKIDTLDEVAFNYLQRNLIGDFRTIDFSSLEGGANITSNFLTYNGGDLDVFELTFGDEEDTVLFTPDSSQVTTVGEGDRRDRAIEELMTFNLGAGDDRFHDRTGFRDSQIYPGAGNDFIYGAGGYDTVNYPTGSRIDYEITVIDERTVEVYYKPEDSTDTLIDVEEIDFDGADDYVFNPYWQGPDIFENVSYTTFTLQVFAEDDWNQPPFVYSPWTNLVPVGTTEVTLTRELLFGNIVIPEGSEADLEISYIDVYATDNSLNPEIDTTDENADSWQITVPDGLNDKEQAVIIDYMVSGQGNALYIYPSENISYASATAPINLTTSQESELLTATAFGDVLSLSDGDDIVEGLAGNDLLQGDNGNDSLDGGEGNDSLLGGAGDDTIIGALGEGNDEYDGGEGSNLLSYEATNVSLNANLQSGIVQNGETEEDSFTNIENFLGSQEADTITGSTADNTLSGLAGDDVIDGKEGNDLVEGRDGNDTLSGSDGDDLLIGGAGEDLLQGGAGIDVLEGNDGDDILDGGDDGDLLRGEAGNDTYSLTLASAVGDVIEDTAGNDTIELSTENEPVTITLSEPTEGQIGISRRESFLVIDINRDGTITPEDDLSIADYFNESGTATGNGFIENVANLSSTEIIDFFGATETPTNPKEISIEDVSTAEGNEGNTELTFAISLSEASEETVTVDYSTADNSATAGEDYTATEGTLEFAPGETEKTIVVEIMGDDIVEEDETFDVRLSNPVNASLADGRGIATITNDDSTSEGSGSNNEFDTPLYRFRNTQIQDTLGTSTYIYVSEAERDSILSNPNLSGAFELEGRSGDQVFPAFTASNSPGSDLVPVYRYRNTQTQTGTYLFSTRDNFQQDTDIVQSNFIEEGDGNPAFYAYPAGSAPSSGFADFTRFENVSVADTFIYTAPAESENIRTNLTGSFTDQGEFWAVGI